MSEFCPVDARNPLGKCLALNTPADMHLQSAWDKKQARQAQAREQEDARIIQVLEGTCAARQCGWRKCDAVLGSWELLRKVFLSCSFGTVDRELKTHLLARGEATLRSTLADGGMFVVTTISLWLYHLPESGIFHRSVTSRACCVIAPKPAEAALSIWYVDRRLDSQVQALVQHLASVHNTSPFQLPRAQLRRPSPRREPLPELPTHAPTYLVGGLQVAPSPSFDPSNAMVAETSEDKWKDFAGIDKPNAALNPFRRLQWPEAVDMATVRKIAQEQEETSDDEESEDTEESL
ncbi:hypothetical protein JB92DRAFT_3112777 [Gautieria morchelliformis]|nr:hypothetical protein JB92DRAFT_3112777 [Gautieria morchelliformis]